MQKYTILWADDEIDLLKPHIMYLEQKGYNVTPVNNAADAVEQAASGLFDIIFLDEHMPGMSGLEAVARIKAGDPALPVVMITKNEEDRIMEEALGAKIDLYLTKPINPSQILASIRTILDKKVLVGEHISHGYRQEFMAISQTLQEDLSHAGWADIYRKLVHWELEMETTGNTEMASVLESQKEEANRGFWKFIRKHYEGWLNDPKADRPLMSHQLLRRKLFPMLGSGAPIFLFLIDNLRLDQWKVLEPILSEYFTVDEESVYYSILPTTTAYARNAIFSGMLPVEMERQHPDLWVGEDDDEGKNQYEEDFLRKQLQREKRDIKFSYHKIKRLEEGKDLVQKFNNLFTNDLNVVVYNFVDMLSHSRTDMAMIRELAPDESAYRSLTRSWFEHSALLDMMKKVSEKGARMVITTDHGTIKVSRPSEILAERSTNTNLRYKHGRSLGLKGDKVLHVTKPERYFLPKPQVNTSYAFVVEDYFFAYPTSYHHYVSLYRDTFQHGGISLEEMIIPVITLSPRHG